jgi:hypothetical protein
MAMFWDSIFNNTPANLSVFLEFGNSAFVLYGLIAAYDPFGNILTMSGPLPSGNKYRFSSNAHKRRYQQKSANYLTRR